MLRLQRPVSHAFLNRLRARLDGLPTRLEPQSRVAVDTINGVFRFVALVGLRGGAALVLSELAELANDTDLIRIIDVLHSLFDDDDVRGCNSAPTDAFVLALANIARRKSCQQVLVVESVRHVNELDVLHDGNSIALHAVFEGIVHAPDADLNTLLSKDDAQLLIEKLEKLIARPSLSKSTGASTLELILILSEVVNDQQRALDDMLDMLEKAPTDLELQDRVAAALKPILNALPNDNVTLVELREKLDSLAQDIGPTARHMSLTLMNALADSLPPEEMLARVLTLLADPDPTVHKRSLQMVMKGALSGHIKTKLAPSLSRVFGDGDKQQQQETNATTEAPHKHVVEHHARSPDLPLTSQAFLGQASVCDGHSSKGCQETSPMIGKAFLCGLYLDKS